MNITCGPINDQRAVTIVLPPKKETLGVFVSGGIDSAILYYLLLKENIALNNLHDIIPFTIFRKEGSSYAAAPVIEHIHYSLGLPLKRALKVGDNTLPEQQQVSSGMQEAYKAGISRVYGGLIQQLPSI
jgi:asparagine synthetase B (glutamine-hydrolysing)